MLLSVSRLAIMWCPRPYKKSMVQNTLYDVQKPDVMSKIHTAPYKKSIGPKHAIWCLITLCNVQNPHDSLYKVRMFKTLLVVIIQSHKPTVVNPNNHLSSLVSSKVIKEVEKVN